MLGNILSLCVQIICIIGCLIGIIIGIRIHVNWFEKSKTLSLYFKIILYLALILYWLALIFNTIELLTREIIGINTIYYTSQFIVLISYPSLLFVVLIGIYARLKQVFAGTTFQPSKITMKILTLFIAFITIIGAASASIYGINTYIPHTKQH